jgi:hypothetical protein
MATRPRARGRSGTAARAGVDASLAVASAAMNTNFARAWSAREQARAWAWAERITALSASRHCPPSFRRPSSGSGLCPLVRIAPASGSSILPQDALRFAPRRRERPHRSVTQPTSPPPSSVEPRNPLALLRPVGEEIRLSASSARVSLRSPPARHPDLGGCTKSSTTASASLLGSKANR